MAMDIHEETKLRLTRRTFLGKTVRGVGSLALASLLTPSLIDAAPKIERWQGIVTTPHVPPKAKTIIHLLHGGRSLTFRDFGLQAETRRITRATPCRSLSPKGNRLHNFKVKRIRLSA